MVSIYKKPYQVDRGASVFNLVFIRFPSVVAQSGGHMLC